MYSFSEWKNYENLASKYSGKSISQDLAVSKLFLMILFSYNFFIIFYKSAVNQTIYLYPVLTICSWSSDILDGCLIEFIGLGPIVPLVRLNICVNDDVKLLLFGSPVNIIVNINEI